MFLLKVVLLLILLGCFQYFIKLISIATAYKAKLLCSGVFISNRSPESIIQEDLSVEDLKYFKLVTAQVDFANQSASASLFGFGRRTAVYDPGMGCTLVYGNKAPDKVYLEHSEVNLDCRPWFLDSGNPCRNDGENLDSTRSSSKPIEVIKLSQHESVLDWAFVEPNPKHQRRTRAVVILLDGQIVAERYAPGFNQDMPLPGWSMAKSVVNALVGILVGQGILDLNAAAPVPEWQGVGDLRREITLGQLMWMTSGLEFKEKSSNPVYDLTKMLLSTPDAAAYAASKPLRAKPGSSWRYASGNTNIVCRIIREALGEEAYRQFPRQALFEPLGMESARFEMDASGTLVGSSFLYATARDWAKFGQLYCQDGLWEGKRILPEGWVSYSTVPCTPDRRFGAHFWLDIRQKKNEPDMATPLPADAFHAMGYEGQCVSIIPSRKLVVVRLGLTRKTSAWRQDHFLNLILDCLSSLT